MDYLLGAAVAVAGYIGGLFTPWFTHHLARRDKIRDVQESIAVQMIKDLDTLSNIVGARWHSTIGLPIEVPYGREAHLSMRNNLPRLRHQNLRSRIEAAYDKAKCVRARDVES